MQNELKISTQQLGANTEHARPLQHVARHVARDTVQQSQSVKPCLGRDCLCERVRFLRGSVNVVVRPAAGPVRHCAGFAFLQPQFSSSSVHLRICGRRKRAPGGGGGGVVWGAGRPGSISAAQGSVLITIFTILGWPGCCPCT